MRAVVEPEGLLPQENDPLRSYSGPVDSYSLRAYRAFHPDARIYVVHRNGQYRWLTWKQRRMLQYIDSSHHRNKRLTLRGIAREIGCHPTTVRRTLMRFHDWGIITYTALVGRFGGSWVMTIKQKVVKWKRRFMDAASRKVERSWLATQIRLYEWRKRWEEKERKASRTRGVLSGYMDATLQ